VAAWSIDETLVCVLGLLVWCLTHCCCCILRVHCVQVVTG